VAIEELPQMSDTEVDGLERWILDFLKLVHVEQFRRDLQKVRQAGTEQ
jgi:hypothetical protein